MLGTLSTCSAIDVYALSRDNAGGIAEMAELPEGVRDKTDALTPRATPPQRLARASPPVPPRSSLALTAAARDR